ncbi:MAG: hypothetical protein IRY95_09760, partial [Clostridia bacterium]|nr:hypothetical protein [Clostridia bacterium]
MEGALEEAVSRLKGVLSARVVAGEGGRWSVRLFVRPDRPVDAVVRDVQTLALTCFGTRIEPRDVRVTSVADPDDLPRGRRLRLRELSIRVDTGAAEVCVALEGRGEVRQGRAVAGYPDQRLQAAATAALAAAASWEPRLAEY